MGLSTPPPGSPAAIAQGCTCPRMDNRNGRGAYTDRDTGKPMYWYASGCSVHDEKEGRESVCGMNEQEERSTAVKCSRCHGKGVVVAMASRYHVYCPVCNGRGWVEI